MDSDGDGLSDAEDPEPLVPAAAPPDQAPADQVPAAEPDQAPADQAPAAQPDEPTEPSDSTAPPEPDEGFEPFDGLESGSEDQYAAIEPAQVDFSEPYEAPSDFAQDETYGSEPSYDTPETYDGSDLEG
jgi:hypothetical protein